MKKRTWMRTIIIGLMACLSTAMAEVTVSFPVTDTTLRNLFTLTFDFTVDGTGNVTLDASTSNGGAAPKAVVDAWDGSVGTITDASFFNTNFTLTAIAKVNGLQSNFLRTSGGATQGLFVDSAPRINEAGAEELVWTFDGPGSLEFTSLTYTNRAATGDSNLTFLDSDTRTEYILPNTSTGGTIDFDDEAFTVVSGQDFIVTTDDLKPNGNPREGVAGACVYAISFDITEASGVATPGNLSAVGTDALVLLDWDDDVSGELDYYTVYRGLASGTTNYAALTTVTNSAYSDANVTNGVTYYYSVTATYSNGMESGYSLEVSATPEEPSTEVVLYQHLDATVGASVTTNGAGEVTAWLDQSGNANDAAPAAANQASEPRYPSSSVSASGLVGVDMRTNRASITLFTAAEADSIFNFTGGASANSGLGILVAFKADSILTNAGVRNLVIGNAANIQDLQIRYDQGALKAHLDGQTFDPGYMVQAGDTVVVGLTYTASTGEAVFWNSGNDVYVTNTLSIAGNLGSSDLRLGGSDNSGQFFDGMIGEVKIFTSTLSAADFDLQLESLVNRWIGAPSFANWATQWGVDIGSETDDYDNNGLSNIEEYGLNGNPTNGTLDPAILPVFGNTGSGFEYIHVARNDDTNLSYTVETTLDLVNIPFAENENIGSVTNISGGLFDSVTNSIPTTDDQLFIRLKIEN